MTNKFTSSNAENIQWIHLTDVGNFHIGPVTHSFLPSHQGRRGTTIERQPLPCQQPTKEVYLTPLCMNNSGTNRSPNSVSPHSGVHPNLPDHPKENPHRRVGSTSESPRSGWRCGLPTTQHRLTRPSPQGQHQPAG